MGRSSEGTSKTRASSSRGRSPSRKSAPTSSSKRSQTTSRSRSRTPTRAAAKSKGTVVKQKRSPSPSPPKKPAKAAARKPRTASKSPSRQAARRKKPDTRASPVRMIESPVSSAGVTPPRKVVANGLSFSQMISESKSKGVAFLSDLFSPSQPAQRKHQPFYRRAWTGLSVPSFKLNLFGSGRPRSSSPGRGGFFPRTRSSSRRRWLSSAAHIFFYLALFALLILIGYIAYVQREQLASRVGYGAKYAQQTYSSFGQRIADTYQKWKNK